MPFGRSTPFRDALPRGPARGRAAGLNPANRFDRLSLHVLGEHLDEMRARHPRGVQEPTQVLDDSTRSIINPVNSDDVDFNWTVNPYRGCEHGCIYCYARPTHEPLGFSCGLDFESRIIVKRDAPELLRRELASPRWKGEPITLAGVTDCYQPLEKTLRITRGCLQIMAACRQPVYLVTKSRLVERDLDLLGDLARHNAARVVISITTLDEKLSAKMEPRASRPADRLHAISALREAGIDTGVMMAPIIPGLTDHEIPGVLKAAADAGATSAIRIVLRLPHQVKALFLEWAQRHFPDRAARIESQVRQLHGGKLYDATFGQRGRGTGPLADQLARTFEVFSKRYGLADGSASLSSDAFRRPALDGQLPLFDAPPAHSA